MGPKKHQNIVKKQFLKSLQKYAQELEKENRELKTNPDTIVGKIINEYQKVLTSNKRLSVLVAAIIKAAGGKVEVKKEDMESFVGMALNIKWELPEGTKNPEDADRYVFIYDAIPDPTAQPPQAPAAPAFSPIPVEVAPASAAAPIPAPAPPVGPAGYSPETDRIISPESGIGSPQEPVPTP